MFILACFLHRAKLFERINSHPTLFEVVTGQAKGGSGKPAGQQVTAGSKRKEGVMVRTAATLILLGMLFSFCLGHRQQPVAAAL